MRRGNGDFVVDGAGNKVNITKANIFVSKGVVHSVGGVLSPKPAATAASTAKALARRLLQLAEVPSWAKPNMPHGKDGVKADTVAMWASQGYAASVISETARLRGAMGRYSENECC